MNLILTGASSTAGAGGSTILMLVLMFAVFYFFFIRPENKKKKKVEDMRNSLRLGERGVFFCYLRTAVVLTAGPRRELRRHGQRARSSCWSLRRL